MDAARLRKCRQENCIYIEVGSIEIEEIHLGGDQGRGDLLCCRGKDILPVVDTLSSEASGQRNRSTTTLFQIAADATAKGGFELNTLHGTLQEVGEATIVPVVPTQEV